MRRANAELAPSTGSAQRSLSNSDFQSITDLVGERIRKMFESPDMYIALYDQGTNILRFDYDIADGQRQQTQPYELGPGLTSEPDSSWRHSRCCAPEKRSTARGPIVDAVPAQSWLLAGRFWLATTCSARLRPERPGLRLYRCRRAAPDDSCLEHGRRPRERSACSASTKRLAETDERAAELALINLSRSAFPAISTGRR